MYFYLYLFAYWTHVAQNLCECCRFYQPSRNFPSGSCQKVLPPEWFPETSGVLRSYFWPPPDRSGVIFGFLRHSGVEIIPPEAFRRYLLRIDFRSAPELFCLPPEHSGVLRSRGLSITALISRIKMRFVLIKISLSLVKIYFSPPSVIYPLKFVDHYSFP